MGFGIIGEPFRTVGGILGKSGRGGFNWIQTVDFEGGNIVIPPPNAWDSTGGAGVVTLLTTPAAAMRGNFGAQVGIPGDSLLRFGDITDPSAEKIFTIQFLFDPNSIVMAPGDIFNMLVLIDSGAGTTYSLGLRNNAGVFDLNPLAKDDAGGNVFGAAMPILDQAMQIRIELMFSTAIGADDGYIKHYINGVLGTAMMNIDNDTRDVNIIRMGAVVGVDAGTNGTFYLDEIQWADQLM